MLGQLHNEFGHIAPLVIHQGPIHDYLGMTLDFSTPGKVQVTMIDHMQQMLKELPEDMASVAAMPATEHLFQINPNPMLLQPSTTEMFHHNVAKLLFLCKCACPDIQTAVVFLSWQV